jgi:hypothetical protein
MGTLRGLQATEERQKANVNGMKPLLFVLVLALFLAGLAIAEELKPHEGFERVRWGASVQEVLKIFPNAKAKPVAVGSPREKAYLVESKVGTVPVELNLIFLDDKFGQALLHFDRKDADQVVDVFKERYGKPVGETQTALTWNVSGTSVMVLRAGVATVSSPEFSEYAEKYRRQSLRDAASISNWC